jgi:PAS domain S-box-containing protein
MSSHPRRRNVRSEKADAPLRLTLEGPRAAASFLPVALEEVSEAIFITDRDDRIQYWNAAAERQYGVPGRTMVGLQLGELYRPSWLMRDGEPLDPKALEAKGSWQGEAVHFTRQGTSMHVQLSVRTLKDGAGTIAGHLWVIQDITERRQAELALQKSEERFRLLAENAKDVVYRYRLVPQRGFEYVSPSVTALTGYTPEEHYASPDLELDLVHPEDRGLLEAYLRGPAANAGPIVLRWLRKDGGIIWTEQRNVPLYDEAGHLVAIEGIVRDISDRRQAEERLQALSRRLLAVQESERRRLARELHDELGQELTAAQIQLQSLAAGRPRATATLLAKTSAIIDRTLNRVRNLSLDLRPSMLDDLGLVAALRWQVDRSAQLVDVKTRFTVDDPQRRYPAEIETACFRVAQEALTNAVRHAEANSIEVRLRREGAELVLEVRDDGIGFDVSKARESAARGASLGLLSMQERAVLTGGTWQVLSEPGSGTIVVARFPISDLAEENQEEEKGS